MYDASVLSIVPTFVVVIAALFWMTKSRNRRLDQIEATLDRIDVIIDQIESQVHPRH